MNEARVTLDDGRTVTVSRDGCIRVRESGRVIVEVNVSDLEHGAGNQGVQFGRGNVQTNVFR
jgi:hypothetical protein